MLLKKILRKELKLMVKETFSNVIEKHGFLTGDPHFHDSGTSSKTGKPYPAFAYLFFLPLNREQTERINIDPQFFNEIEDVTKDMVQTQRIVIVGEEDASGRFLASEVHTYEKK